MHLLYSKQFRAFYWLQLFLLPKYINTITTNFIAASVLTLLCDNALDTSNTTLIYLYSKPNYLLLTCKTVSQLLKVSKLIQKRYYRKSTWSQAGNRVPGHK